MTEKILVFGAHPDDQVFGPGGTLIKYAREGKEILIVTFSKGEGTHPWLKEDVIIEMRKKENEKVNKEIGVTNTIYFGLKDNQLAKEAKEQNTISKVKDIIREFSPNKIFTHTAFDPYPDHKTVHKIIVEAFDELQPDCDLYTFDVWNPLNSKGTNHPKLVVDISKTFKKKVQTLKQFKTQKVALFSLLWTVYFRAIHAGLKNHYKYAEVFYKIR